MEVLQSAAICNENASYHVEMLFCARFDAPWEVLQSAAIYDEIVNSYVEMSFGNALTRHGSASRSSNFAGKCKLLRGSASLKMPCRMRRGGPKDGSETSVFFF